MRFPFFTPGFYPTTVSGTPSNSQLEQMVVEEGLATYAGVFVYDDAAPDVVLYPDLAKCTWHKTVAGVKTGFFYFYNGTAWTPTRVSPGTLTGDSFADGSIGIEKLTPGSPFYVPQVNAAGDAVVWVAAPDLFSSGSLAWGKLAYASGQDNFLVSNVGGDWAEVTKAVAANKLSTAFAAAPITTFDDLANDGLCTFQATGNLAKSISHLRYLEMLIEAYTALVTTTDACKVAVLDPTATAGNRMRHVTLNNLLPDKGTAGVYANPTSITTDSKGRVTAVATAGSGTRFQSDLYSLPAVAGTANRITIPHGMSAKPGIFTVTAICQVAENGFVIGDVIDLHMVKFDTGSAAYNAEYCVHVDATNFYVMKPSYTTAWVQTIAASPVYAAFTAASWKFRITALQ